MKCTNCNKTAPSNKLRTDKNKNARFCCEDCLKEYEERVRKRKRFTDAVQKYFGDEADYELLTKQSKEIEKNYGIDPLTQARIIKYACEYEDYVPKLESYGLYQFSVFKTKALNFMEKLKQAKKEANTPEFDNLLDSICQPIYRKNTRTKECYKIIPKDELDFSFLENT